MKRLDALLLIALVALGVGVAVLAARIADRYPGTRTELGRVKLTDIAPETAERLRALEDPVLATYFVSPKNEMPSELRRLEDDVREVLAALAEASDGRFEYQVLDPHANETEEPEDGQAQPQGPQAESAKNARYAARQGIAPFRVRSITRDSWSEKTVWSSLTLAYGASPPAVLNGLSAEQLPRLQQTLLAHLDQMDNPRKPRVAVAAPPGSGGFGALRLELERVAEVVEWDPTVDGPEIPRKIDLLFWLEPGDEGSIPPAQLRELDRFLASGRSAVVAGHRWIPRTPAPAPGTPGDPLAYRLESTGFDADTVWSHFGLRPVRESRGLLCDKFSLSFRTGPEENAEQLFVPFMVRCIAPNQRFKLALRGTPNGTLMFETPSALALDAESLMEKGWEASVLAHTSDGTWFHPAPPPRELASALDVRRETGVASSRQTLGVLLSPTDPWQGSVVALASSSMFRDDWIAAEGYAHRRLIDVLVRNLANDERLVVHATDSAVPEPLPELTVRERVVWRLACVALFPALLLVLALVRGAFGSAGSSLGALTYAASLRGSGRLLVALGVVLVALRLAGDVRARIDLSEDGLNRLAPKTTELAAAATGEHALVAEVLFTRDERLPPAMRPAVRRMDDLLAELEDAGAELERRRIYPEDLEDPVAELGIEPVRFTSREEGVTTVRTVYSALRLSSPGTGRTETLLFDDLIAFEDLEFRLAFALWRLATGRRPVVALATDAPRFSPAEAFEFQQKGQFAPIGEDPYSLARVHLEDLGFDVAHVNPREPRFPETFDSLIWIQPRRDATAMIEALSRVLHRGGRVLLAAQHFKMQARQYRGTNFATVYWPQPQTPDVDLYWFPELGIRLEREVLFDELKAQRALETQVNRNSSLRDYEEQDSASPFFVRLAAANFADDPLLAGAGDQLFAYGNRITWDAERLAELGIEAEVLATTSDRAWAFDWSGGYLPGTLLEDRPTAEERPRAAHRGRRGARPLPRGGAPDRTLPRQLPAPRPAVRAPEGERRGADPRPRAPGRAAGAR